MKKIMFSVGEPSGEMLAIEVIKKLKILTNGNIVFFGMGGERLQSYGLELIVDSSDLAVIGFVEVFQKWFSLQRAQKKMRDELLCNPPDVLILVDYVEFNLRLGKVAKLLNIPVLFYVSPQIWAWGKQRIKRIVNATDRIASIFPFEVDMYESTKINASYVGHPLTEIISSSLNQNQARAELKISTNQKLIGILPGSRVSELKKHLPILKNTIFKLNKIDQNCIFLMAGAPNMVLRDLISSWTSDLYENGVTVKVMYNKTYEIIAAADIIAVASGTATLECALLRTPMVVFYKTSHISYFILKKLILVKYISLVNILLGRESVPELIQKNANSVALTNAMLDLLNSMEKQKKQLNEFKEIRKMLGKKSASQSVAKLVIQMSN